jgi:hypothetical protein
MPRTIQEIFKTESTEIGGAELVTASIRFRHNFKAFTEEVFGFDVQPFHLEWVRMIMSGHRHIGITAPTGFGKTTILGTSYVIWRCLFEKDKEFLIVSKSMPQSIKVLENIRLAIEQNEFLTEMLMPDQTVRTSRWTKTELMTKTGCQIYCKPMTENIRGYHVDYILADEAATYSDHDVFFRWLVTRVEAKGGIIVAISTPFDIADLMEILKLKTSWKSVLYKAIGDDGTLLWPTKFTRQRLAEIRDNIGAAAFEREYLCNPKAQAENALFPPELIAEAFDYKAKFGPRALTDSMVFLGCDFAIAAGTRADFDSYVVVERMGDKAVIRHGETHKGLSVFAKVSRIEQLYNEYRVTKIVIDPSSIGSAVGEKLREKMLPFEAADFASANRNKMLINARQLFEEKRMIIPRDSEDSETIRFTNTLVQELLSFQEVKTKSQLISYQSAGPHDDTVMSLILACKPITEQRDFMDFVAV